MKRRDYSDDKRVTVSVEQEIADVGGPAETAVLCGPRILEVSIGVFKIKYQNKNKTKQKKGSLDTAPPQCTVYTKSPFRSTFNRASKKKKTTKDTNKVTSSTPVSLRRGVMMKNTERGWASSAVGLPESSNVPDKNRVFFIKM